MRKKTPRTRKVKDMDLHSGRYSYKASIGIDASTGDFRTEKVVRNRDGEEVKVEFVSSTLKEQEAKLREWAAALDGLEWKPAVMFEVVDRHWNSDRKRINRTVMVLDADKKFERTKADYVKPFRDQCSRTMVFFVGEDDAAIKAVDDLIAMFERACNERDRINAMAREVSAGISGMASSIEQIATLEGVTLKDGDAVAKAIMSINIPPKFLTDGAIEV